MDVFKTRVLEASELLHCLNAIWQYVYMEKCFTCLPAMIKVKLMPQSYYWAQLLTTLTSSLSFGKIYA